MPKSALITGVIGQNGTYPSQLLSNKGYEIYGFIARRGSDMLWRLRELGVVKRRAALERRHDDIVRFEGNYGRGLMSQDHR